ncbi:ANTAR domain-containing response regulator [Pseudobacteroides cellulosolvens]|uniref:ANTAR domain-containing protein n=1 Tax=Pseudobacteroides cellulosolvens ATCC 35603 = DSM 2933 TaxID=398512 RepID=A0A0L6JMK0_9FIRM|nr:ANTAR domain-containing protein [Pseudobacteroides cellulosolvens]KNY26990.1 ANTAR domain protein with unknown sensor [Pseudobacteroides cellulosolvens ATCC 35603 = DSM 2933]
MSSEKYIVAAADNPSQISIRNILNPYGFMFLGNCSDSISLLRLIRSYNPDFVVIDMGRQLRDIMPVIDTIDDEMLCACILVGQNKDVEIEDLQEKSKIVTLCPKPLSKDLFIHTVEMALLSFKRILKLDRKLREMTENYETRKAVERAKWILMEREGISENDAYERMRKKSMDTRTPIKALAEAIIFAYELRND